MKLLPGLPSDGVELSWFCAKGKMIYRAKKNLRIAEAELNCFLSEATAGAFPAPMLAVFHLMNESNGPAKTELGQVLEGQRLEFALGPQTAKVLTSDYGAVSIDRIERFERVKVPKLRLTVQMRFQLTDQAAIWLKNSIGTTVFVSASEAQLPLPLEAAELAHQDDEEAEESAIPMDRKSAAAGERDDDPRDTAPVPSALDGLSAAAEERRHAKDMEEQERLKGESGGKKKAAQRKGRKA